MGKGGDNAHYRENKHKSFKKASGYFKRLVHPNMKMYRLQILIVYKSS